MSQRLPIPPTRNALLEVKAQLEFLSTGHDLLERKQELLTRMVREQTTTYRKLRQKAGAQVQQAYRWLSMTHLRMGSRMLQQAALGLEPSMQVKILPRSNLGVDYPAVKTKQLPLQPVSLMWNDASFDQAREQLSKMALILAELGEAEIALRRMLKEQRKTQKRVNALKYNIIPRYRETIRFIQDTLEEEERNTLFQIKHMAKQQSNSTTVGSQ